MLRRQERDHNQLVYIALSLAGDFLPRLRREKGRYDTLLSAALFARSEPHRNGIQLMSPGSRAPRVLLGEPGLKGVPLVFVCHSLGGPVMKQVLRAADGRRAYGLAEAAFRDSVKGVVFIATPHTGSPYAAVLDRLRLIAWPSASTLDLVKNNAGLRDLNIWYRNRSGASATRCSIKSVAPQRASPSPTTAAIRACWASIRFLSMRTISTSASRPTPAIWSMP
jgi:hypothetical protein